MTRAFRFPATVLCALLSLPAATLAQETTGPLTGELAACYVGQDLSNEEHLACAGLCMELAVPMVLVAQDGHVYVPTGSNADQLSEHANDLVEIQGTVGEQAECRTIAVDKIKRAKPPEARGGYGKALTSRLITEKDLANLPDMSLYELLRQHAEVRIEDYPGAGGGRGVIFCAERETINTYRGCPVIVNEREAHDPIATARDLSIHELSRIEILRRSEASNRYGGSGMIGAIVVRTKSN